MDYLVKYSVKWETDGKKVNHLPEIVDVPREIEVDEVAEWLSNKYGWLISSLAKVGMCNVHEHCDGSCGDLGHN